MRVFVHEALGLLALVVGTRCQISTTWASSRFIGYYVAPDSVEPLLAGNAWVTSGSFAGDCSATESCAIATACDSGTLYYNNLASLSCGAGYTCVQMTIFAKSPNVLPSAYNYACRMGWEANTVYRELAASTTSSSSVASSTLTPGSMVPTSTPSITSAASTPTSIQTSTPPSASRSQAWIAGAVVGPVIGIALIAAIFFWWRRRAQRRGKGQAYELHQEYPEYTSAKQYHEKGHDAERVELPSSEQAAELSADGLPNHNI